MSEHAALLAGLRHSPALLAELVVEIPATRLRERRGEGFWTIAQHVAHLAEVQPMLTQRLRRILNEDRPRFEPFFPDEATEAAPNPPLSADAALAALRAERARQLALLEPLGPADWRREAEHPEYDRYGLVILVRHMLLHEHWHMYRIEELWLTRDAYLTKLEG